MGARDPGVVAPTFDAHHFLEAVRVGLHMPQLTLRAACMETLYILQVAELQAKFIQENHQQQDAISKITDLSERLRLTAELQQKVHTKVATIQAMKARPSYEIMLMATPDAKWEEETQAMAEELKSAERTTAVDHDKVVELRHTLTTHREAKTRHDAREQNRLFNELVDIKRKAGLLPTELTIEERPATKEHPAPCIALYAKNTEIWQRFERKFFEIHSPELQDMPMNLSPDERQPQGRRP